MKTVTFEIDTTPRPVKSLGEKMRAILNEEELAKVAAVVAAEDAYLAAVREALLRVREVKTHPGTADFVAVWQAEDGSVRSFDEVWNTHVVGSMQVVEALLILRAAREAELS